MTATALRRGSPGGSEKTVGRNWQVDRGRRRRTWRNEELRRNLILGEQVGSLKDVQQIDVLDRPVRAVDLPLAYVEFPREVGDSLIRDRRNVIVQLEVEVEVPPGRQGDTGDPPKAGCLLRLVLVRKQRWERLKLSYRVGSQLLICSLRAAGVYSPSRTTSMELGDFSHASSLPDMIRLYTMTSSRASVRGSKRNRQARIPGSTVTA